MIGLVIKSTGSVCLVKTEDGQKIQCTIRGKLRLSGSKSTNPVVVGDWVKIQAEGDQRNISEVEERKNYIVRKSVNLSKQTHVIAANLDQTLLVVTLINPKTNTEFIDRYLCTAEAYKIPAILVFNKVDIYSPELLKNIDDLIHIYEKIGYTCIMVSATTGDGMEDLRNLLTNKVSLISGNSGVGKSSIINFIEPEYKLRVAEISTSHLKGKHTTTFSEMHELSAGGYIIDTPGIKGFGIVNIGNEELFHFFPEMFRLTNKCQYYNCTHIHEPNCAVRLAVESGDIAESRYISYVNILCDENEKHRS
jgi:ribosome biogenesis GTPase / thiamine phosphate phosphatase